MYPADVQAAQARVAAQNAGGDGGTSGYGSPAGGSSQAGHHPMVVNPAGQ
jgi:hypothetical protein